MSFFRAVGTCAGIGTAASLLYLAPHTIFLEKIRLKLARHRFNKELQVPKSVRSRLDEVLRDLRVPPEHAVRLKLLEVSSFDLFNMGLVTSRYGAFLAIPATFVHQQLSTLNKQDIKMFDLPINWALEEAQEFAKNLIISDKAQKAALAFSVLKIEAREPRQQAIFTGFHAANLTAMYLYTRHRVKHKKQFMVLVTIAGVITWVLGKDYLSRGIEKDCDAKLAALGPQYVEGSKEYLDKVIQRNIAARKLLQPYGERLFTEEGNLRQWFRRKCLQNTQRRSFYLSKLEDLA